MSRLRFFSTLVLLAFSCSGGSIFGQQMPPVTQPPGTPKTRSIEGCVLDENGNPVSDAVVLLKDTRTLQIRSYIASKDGSYHFYGVSSDVNYEVRAQANGSTSKQQTISVFDSHQIIKQNLKLTEKKAKK